MRSKRKRYLISIVSLSLLLAGCEKKDTPTAVISSPQSEVHNAFTDYVDRGVTTMNKAKSVAATANAQNQAVSQQAQSAGE